MIYCDCCYTSIVKDEDQLLKMSIENGDNPSTLIKQEYIKDYFYSSSSKSLIQLMKIHEIVVESKDFQYFLQ